MSSDPAASPSSDRAAWLRALVMEDAPAAVAVIGKRAAATLGLEVEAGEVESLAGAPVWQRFGSPADCLRAAPERRNADVALFVPDSLDDGFERALGTACRLFPGRLLLLVEAPDLPAPERLFAFGFRRVEAVAAPDAVLYEYRLRDYKQPPDWLNARFWANPSRFDLDEAPSEFEDDDFEDDEFEDDAGERTGGDEPQGRDER